MAKIEPGEHVVIVLHSPREKFWGALHELYPSGVYARGIDLNAFDEFIRAVRNDEPFYGISETFFPLWRVERISMDETHEDIPSMSDQFSQRTGRDLSEFLSS
jgi:hypothetical protein